MREAITEEEVITFIHKTQISKFIIIETCYAKVFDIARLCQGLGVKTIGIINLETVRYSEVHKHDFFDVIVCNNKYSYHLIHQYILTRPFSSAFEC